MCITGSFLKQNNTLKTFFACGGQNQKEHSHIFFTRGEQNKKKILEMCTTGGHLKVLKPCSHESEFAILKLVFFYRDILAAENIRNYQSAVLKIFRKILEKISFFDTHMKAKMQSNAFYWGDSLRCGQTEVYLKVTLVVPKNRKK